MIFKDSSASIGRPRSVAKDKVTIPATSPSRSLDSLINPSSRKIQIEIRDNGLLVLDLSAIIGNKVKITKIRALQLAKWIIMIYDLRSQNRKAR